jgi:hypothetical protein
MNFAEIDDDEGAESKVLMMNTYDRLLRMRNILDHNEFKPIPKHALFDTFHSLKKEYLDIVYDVLTGHMNMHAKKEKASYILNILNSLGNKDIKYVNLLHEVVEQFDRDECVTDNAEKLNEKTMQMLSIREVLSLCKGTTVTSDYICFLCLERPVNVFIDPCGHVVCEECSTRSALHVCPFCRGAIHQYRKMFLG